MSRLPFMRPFPAMVQACACGLRRRRAFTLVEVAASLFILALAVGACLAVVSLRGNGRGRTEALEAAPAAIDALELSLNAAGSDALAQEFAAGVPRRIAYARLLGAEGRLAWTVADPATLSAPAGASGPVFVATLTNPRMQQGGVALEFDVALDWLRPGAADETAAALNARLDALAAEKAASGQHLCTYGMIVLKNGLIVK